MVRFYQKEKRFVLRMWTHYETEMEPTTGSISSKAAEKTPPLGGGCTAFTIGVKQRPNRPPHLTPCSWHQKREHHPILPRAHIPLFAGQLAPAASLTDIPRRIFKPARYFSSLPARCFAPAGIGFGIQWQL